MFTRDQINGAITRALSRLPMTTPNEIQNVRQAEAELEELLGASSKATAGGRADATAIATRADEDRWRNLHENVLPPLSRFETRDHTVLAVVAEVLRLRAAHAAGELERANREPKITRILLDVDGVLGESDGSRARAARARVRPLKSGLAGPTA